MKRLSLTILGMVILATPAFAQRLTAPAAAQAVQPLPPAPETDIRGDSKASNPESDANYSDRSPGETALTPEMKRHEQMYLRDQERMQAYYRDAQARAENRTRRLESRKWYGLSNQRPSVSVDPYDGDYAPTWTSNNTFSPYQWSGGGQNWLIIRGN